MRDVDDAMVAAMDAGHWRPVVAVRLDWPGGEVRYHSRIGPATLDGEVWEGVGGLGQIEGLEESEGVAVREVVLSLTGFLEDQLAKVRGVKIRNRAAEILLGAVDANGAQVGTLVRLFRGRMRAKSFPIREANEVGFRHMIQVRVQNHFASVRRPREVRLEHPRLAALRHETPSWPE